MSSDNWRRQQLESHDQARLAGRADRATRTSVHGIIPGRFFAAASSECRDIFIDGHYYARISLSQAVAEGLAQFLGDLHNVRAKNDPKKRVQRLLSKGVITRTACDAFDRIWGNDRNTFHHLNPDILTDYEELERRADDCVNALLKIESEVFAHEIIEGQIAPKNPAYWPKTDPKHMKVFLRLSGH